MAVLEEVGLLLVRKSVEPVGDGSCVYAALPEASRMSRTARSEIPASRRRSRTPALEGPRAWLRVSYEPKPNMALTEPLAPPAIDPNCPVTVP
jgi:hypothetical protein